MCVTVCSASLSEGRRSPSSPEVAGTQRDSRRPQPLFMSSAQMPRILRITLQQIIRATYKSKSKDR